MTSTPERKPESATDLFERVNVKDFFTRLRTPVYPDDRLIETHENVRTPLLPRIAKRQVAGITYVVTTTVLGLFGWMHAENMVLDELDPDSVGMMRMAEAIEQKVPYAMEVVDSRPDLVEAASANIAAANDAMGFWAIRSWKREAEGDLGSHFEGDDFGAANSTMCGAASPLRFRHDALAAGCERLENEPVKNARGVLALSVHGYVAARCNEWRTYHETMPADWLEAGRAAADIEPSTWSEKRIEEAATDKLASIRDAQVQVLAEILAVAEERVSAAGCADMLTDFTTPREPSGYQLDYAPGGKKRPPTADPF